MQIREIWQSRKGYKALQYRVPPLTWDGFAIHLGWVSGTAPHLAITNHENLAFIDPRRGICEQCIEPLGKQQEFFLVSGCFSLRGFSPQHEQYIVAAISDGTFVVMSGKCQFRERLCVNFPNGFPYDASQMIVSKDAVLWLWTPEGDLYAIDIRKSEITGIWHRISGIASNEGGDIYIAASSVSFPPPVKTIPMSGKQVSEDLLRQGIISETAWARFVGADQWGASYWWIEQRKASLIVRWVQGKGVVRYLALRGRHSLVKRLRTERSQIDSICVSERGDVYFVGYSYHRQSPVCVYGVNLI